MPTTLTLLLSFLTHAPELGMHQAACHAVYPELSPAPHFAKPVGRQAPEGWYDAQPFGRNRHLGQDLNLRTGGNTDLGEPVLSMASGVVSSAKNHGGGWGNTVRVVHKLPSGECIESLYAHLYEIDVRPGQLVTHETQLGTVGNNNGMYSAHLHFEVRSKRGMGLGGGYGKPDGYLNPADLPWGPQAPLRTASAGR